MNDIDSCLIFAKVQLTYLHYAEFTSWSVKMNEDQIDERYNEYPALEACQDWGYKAAFANEDDNELFALLCEFLQPRKTHSFLLWLHMFYSTLGKVETPRSATTLHFAAQYGLSRVCEWLLSKGADPNSSDKILATPLICVIAYRGETPQL